MSSLYSTNRPQARLLHAAALIALALATTVALPDLATAKKSRGKTGKPGVRWATPMRGHALSGVLRGSGCKVRARGRRAVRQVTFYLDGHRRRTDRRAPFHCRIDTTELRNGRHRVRAVARDRAGRRHSLVTVIRVKNTPRTHRRSRPRLKWNNPRPRNTVSRTLTGAACEVSARSASGIDRVVFAVDGRGLNTELSAPYNCVLDTTQLSAGTHTLTAVARDKNGKSSSRSQPINVANGGGGTTPSDPAGVVFNGDFDTGNASQWGSQQCNAGRFGFGSSSPSPLLGSGWMRFEVREGDRETLTGSNRCEVADWRDGHYLRDGQEAWIRWQAQFTSLPIDANSPWSGQVIWQLHPRAGVSPTLSMMVNRQGRFQLDDNQRTFVYWTGPTVQLYRWYDFVLHINNSTNNSVGFAELSVDQAQQAMANGQTRIYHATAYDDQNYPKLGIYRSPDHAGTTVMYGDGYQIGNTPSAVGL